jgi:thiol-disulfide isomerase/thioredoxin
MPVKTVLFMMCSSVLATGPAESLKTGTWRGWLDSAGGELPFRLELARSGENWSAWLINGAERAEVPRVAIEGDELILDLEHYDATIRAKVSADGGRLDGEWSLRRGADRWTRLPFHATAGAAPQFPPDANSTDDKLAPRIDGRWPAKFSQTEEPIIGVFATQDDGTVTGTFLAPSGDYRFLAGSFAARRLRLASFDGRHALLFDAKLGDNGTLTGDLWSGDSWHETWTAHLDPNAELPDGLARLKDGKTADLSKLVYKDPEGKKVSLADAASGAKILIVEIFGTWCPNCHDAGAYLEEINRRYREKGVAVVGLAFESTGDFAHDAAQVKRFGTRHSITYPLLIAGERGKDKVTDVVPLLDRAGAFPTTLFVDAGGRVRAVHSGFSGPATGDDFRKQCIQTESLIEELLAASTGN